MKYSNRYKYQKTINDRIAFYSIRCKNNIKILYLSLIDIILIEQKLLIFCNQIGIILVPFILNIFQKLYLGTYYNIVKNQSKYLHRLSIIIHFLNFRTRKLSTL